MKQIKENAKTKMEKSINVMLSDFAGIRAGRANPSVLNKVQACSQMLRVPRGKGKISITCRNCGTVFQEKT